MWQFIRFPRLATRLCNLYLLLWRSQVVSFAPPDYIVPLLLITAYKFNKVLQYLDDRPNIPKASGLQAPIQALSEKKAPGSIAERHTPQTPLKSKI